MRVLVTRVVPFLVAAAISVPASPQIRTTRPPVAAPSRVLANPNPPQADWHPAPDEQFTALTFIVKTGDDDLRDNSGAWLDFSFPDGTQQRCLLKDFNTDAWGNNTAHQSDIPQCILQKPRTYDELRKTTIVLTADGASHAAAFQSPDNWNINEFRIRALDVPQQKYPCVLYARGNPLVRLTGSYPRFVLTQTPNLC
jgi:hypothetical protein